MLKRTQVAVGFEFKFERTKLFFRAFFFSNLFFSCSFLVLFSTFGLGVHERDKSVRARTSGLKGDAITFRNLKFVIGSHVRVELCIYTQITMFLI